MEKPYVAGHSTEEQKRLLTQAAVYDHKTRPFLNGLLHPGMTVLEIGCGVGSATQIIAGILASNGFLTALDQDKRAIAYTKARTLSNGYDRVDFICDDIFNLEPNLKFDFIYGRAVLHHINNLPSILSKLKNHLKPRGILAFEEPVMDNFPDNVPNQKLYYKLLKAYCALGDKLSMSSRVGQELHSIFVELGLSITSLSAYYPVLMSTEEKKIINDGLAMLKPQLIDNNLLDVSDIAKMQEKLTQLATDKNTCLFYPLFYQIAGCLN